MVLVWQDMMHTQPWYQHIFLYSPESQGPPKMGERFFLFLLRAGDFPAGRNIKASCFGEVRSQGSGRVKGLLGMSWGGHRDSLQIYQFDYLGLRATY